MAPRVEKTVVFRKGWNFPNRTFFCELHNEKTFFSIMDERFFFICTMELFSTGLNYLTAESTLILNQKKTFFKQKSSIKGAISELRSSHLFRDQPYKEVLEVKCRVCKFTGVLSFTSILRTLITSFRPFFRRTSHNLVCHKFAILKIKNLLTF